MMIVRIALMGLIGLGLIAACAPVKLLNATIPSEGYDVHPDISYGDDARQKLDVYVPETASETNRLPVIVFFYGGSWKMGNKNDYLFLGQAFASKGFITVVADYRLYPQVYYPDFARDGAQIVRWVHEHISDYSGDPDKLFVAGHSAGAHTAMMITLNKSFYKEAGVDERWIKGTIGISGPYDFTFTDEQIKAVFSKVPQPESQPINYVTDHNPPILLASGDDDDVVLLRNTEHLETKLLSMHNTVEKKVYPGIGHIGIMLSLARGFRSKTPLLEDIATFVNKYEGTTVKPNSPLALTR